MKRILFIFFLTFFGVQSSLAQSAKTDSLEARLKFVEANERIPILIELAELNQRDSEKALGYVDEAEKLLDAYPDPARESLLLGRTGWIYYYMRDFDTALEFSVNAEQIALEISHYDHTARAQLLRGRLLRDNDEFEESIAVLDSALVLTNDSSELLLRSSILNELGTVYRRIGNSQKALEFHAEALDLVEKSGDKEALSVTYNLTGITNDILGNYDDALRYYLQSLRVREGLNDQRGMAASMTNLGILHQRLEQYPEALDFYEQSLAIWKDLDAKDPLASTLNNTGAVYELMEDYETAREYYEQAHEIWVELGKLSSISISLNNLATMDLYLGNYEQALDLKQQVFNHHLELGNVVGTASVSRDIATIYREMEQPDSAMATAQQSLEFALESGSWQQIRNAHELLYELHEDSGDFEQALEHHKLFEAANDTLFNADSQSIIAELQEQYRTRQQQQEIELLQQSRELQKLWFFLVIGGFTTAFIVAGFMYNRYKMKVRNREKLHLAEIEKTHLAAENAEAKTKLLDAENRRKTKELEDARNLQLSMLPSDLPECSNASITAYMKTAAEVGGDYYDVDLQDDGTLTFCIGDATGHGTKAGLLVMAMKSLFNLTSREKDLRTIMHRCSAAIKRMNLSQLYMAFAVVRLKGDTLELVGGGMPPALLYRCATGKVESIDLKGMPLGSVPDYPYELSSVSFCKDDVLVLLSDGYAELHNEQGEMMGYEKPAELLSKAGCAPIDEIIAHFRKAADEWTDSSSPNDDMTFVVVKRNGD